MKSTLIKKTKQGTEEMVLWVKGSDLHFSQAFYDDRHGEEGKTKHGTEAKAIEALEARVSSLLTKGYVLAGERKPAPAPKKAAAASKPRGFTPPPWLRRLTKAHEKHRLKLEAAAKKAGLGHRWPEIQAIAKPAIELSLAKAKSAPKGVVSRMGGDPDLAKGIEWPMSDGRPLQFVAQIVLADVHPHDLEDVLPATGRIALFAQLDAEHDDYCAVARVLFIDDGAPVARTSAPKKTASPTDGVGLLTPQPWLTIPYYEDPAVEALKLTGDERSRYHDELYLPWFERAPLHLLLGHASYGTPWSTEGHRFLAQLAADDRVGFSEGDDQTLRFYFDGNTADPKSAVCTLEQA